MASRGRTLLPYLLVLAGAVFLIWNTFHFRFTPHGDRLSPYVWPRAILVAMIVTCVARIVTVLRTKRGADANSADEEGISKHAIATDEAVVATRYPMLLFAGIGLTIAYIGLLNTLGFFLDSVLFVGVLIRVGRYRRWSVIGVVSVAGVLVFMLVFMKIVYLSLPIGRPPFSTVSLVLMQIMHIR